MALALPRVWVGVASADSAVAGGAPDGTHLPLQLAPPSSVGTGSDAAVLLSAALLPVCLYCVKCGAAGMASFPSCHVVSFIHLLSIARFASLLPCCYPPASLLHVSLCCTCYLHPALNSCPLIPALSPCLLPLGSCFSAFFLDSFPSRLLCSRASTTDTQPRIRHQPATQATRAMLPCCPCCAVPATSDRVLIGALAALLPLLPRRAAPAAETS